MTGGGPVPTPRPERRRRGARPRPRTYIDADRQPPYSQDRMRWPSSELGTYRHADQAGDNTETEDT